MTFLNNNKIDKQISVFFFDIATKNYLNEITTLIYILIVSGII